MKTGQLSADRFSNAVFILFRLREKSTLAQERFLWGVLSGRKEND